MEGGHHVHGAVELVLAVQHDVDSFSPGDSHTLVNLSLHGVEGEGLVHLELEVNLLAIVFLLTMFPEC